MSKGVGIAGGEHSLYFDKAKGELYSTGACGLGWCRLLPLHPDLFGFRKVLFSDNVVTKVHASYYHNLAVTKNNKLYSWGCGTFVEGNSDGVIPALGPGVEEDKGKQPHQVLLPPHKKIGSISQVTGGAYHSAVLLTSPSSGGRAGGSQSQVLTFGAGQLGQLGRPISGTDASGLPVDSTLQPVQGLPKNDTVTTIGAGFYNTFAICQSGKLFCAGENQNNQCGAGPNNLYRMTHVQEIDKSKVNQVEGGYCHTLIQTIDGLVYSMGCGDDGQRGDGRVLIDDDDDEDDDEMVNTQQEQQPIVSPVKIPIPAQSVAAGANHSVVLGTNGVAYTFGSNDVGQCGIINEGEPISTPTPVKLPHEAGKVIHISAGYAHTVMTTESGELYVFGQNDNGQLGLGSSSAANPEAKTKPMKIPIPS